MNRSISIRTQPLKLNEEFTSRAYTAEVMNYIKQGKKKTQSGVVIAFDLTYKGTDEKGMLIYIIEVKKRFLINNKKIVIRKPDKAERLALKVAAVNDVLELRVDKNYKLIRVVNTEEIRIKWKELKDSILDDYPDLIKMIRDFDWQLEEDNIQKMYLEDNFYQCFFANIFYQEFEPQKGITASKIIMNGMGNINIPVVEQKKMMTQGRRRSSSLYITTSAKMDVEQSKFPLEKLNLFLGHLPTTSGEQHELDFDYKGEYTVKPDIGLLTKGQLAYSFEVKGLYKKTTTITFNLENNE